MSRYSREPAAQRIARHEARIKDLDERIGRLMTRRADEEENLADALKLLARIEARTAEPEGDSR